MDDLNDEDFWHQVMGDSDEEEGDFFGFEADGVDRDVESDLDVDLAEVQTDLAQNSDSNSDSDGDVDDQPQWTQRLSEVTVEPFSDSSGVIHDLPVGAAPSDFFQLFFTDDLLEMIVHETNRYAEQKIADKGVADPRWQPVTIGEVKLFIAINIMMGLHICPRIELYWSTDEELNVPAISKLMSRTRYEKINQYLHLNDRTHQIPRGQPGYDALFKVRPAIDAMLQKFPHHYKPGREISIDEAMIKFSGRVHIKQYMKGKPTPWGIKVWAAADPRTGYLLDFDVYTGKDRTRLPGGLGQHVVMKMGRHYLQKGHHFYYDNFFTSVELANRLLAEKTYSCGTIRMNRKGWPKELKFSKKTKKDEKLRPGQVKMMQMGNLVATAWQDKRLVAVLSTNCQPEMGSALRQTGVGPRAPKDIPQAVLTYNSHMGGVDLHDQNRTYYRVGRPSKKWWRYLFWFMVQASLINAFIIFKKSTMPRSKSAKEHDPMFFRLAVFRGLTKGNSLTRRQAQSAGTLVGRAVSDPTEHRQTRMPGRKRNCVQCQRRGQRAPSGRGHQTVYGCVLCKVNLCQGLCFAQFHHDILQ